MVSGFNVGIVTFILILFLKLCRVPRNARFFMSVPLLIVYCLLTGASTPVVRATVMALVFLCASLVKREPDIYNSLCIAALCILVAQPAQIFDVGFQLSFVSVISIVYLYPRIKAALPVEAVKNRALAYIIDASLVSFSAWLGTCGLIAYYFKIFSPVTVLANLFIVPLATLITLCGFSLLAINVIFPPLTVYFAGPCELLVALLLWINSLLMQFPWAYFILLK